MIGKYFLMPFDLDEGLAGRRRGLGRSCSAWRSSAGQDLLVADLLLVGEAQVARGRVMAVHGQELGDVAIARVELVRAARMERASRRHVDQGRREPSDRIQPLLLLVVQTRDRAQETPRVGVQRLVIDVVGCSRTRRPCRRTSP